MRRFLTLAIAVATPLSAFSSVLFQQTDISADGYASDGISTNGGQFYSQAMADNFNLSSDSTITDIKFWGSSENYNLPDLSNMTAFDIAIYDASFHLIAYGTIATDSLNPTPTGYVNSNFGYEYAFDLPTNFDLAAGSYNLHVGADLADPNGDAFIWSIANGDNSLAANFMAGGGWQVIAQEPGLAFELDGSPAPEPASLAALAIGAAALYRRRKSARA